MYRLEDVTNWFLSKSAMTPKKLQKLLYYAYAWYLTLQNDEADRLERRLFVSNFEAWVHGPVIPEIYNQYREYGFNEIPKFEGTTVDFDEDTIDILNQVWDVYGGYNGNQLEALTHQESPWMNARKGYRPLDRCNEIISDRDIFECYIQRVH